MFSDIHPIKPAYGVLLQIQIDLNGYIGDLFIYLIQWWYQYLIWKLNIVGTTIPITFNRAVFLNLQNPTYLLYLQDYKGFVIINIFNRTCLRGIFVDLNYS